MEPRRPFELRQVPRARQPLILACLFFWSIVSYLAISRCLVRSAEVVGSSMEPTLRAGELTIVNRLVYRTRAPSRGEIAALWLAPGDESAAVKRVIALPGETVQIRRGRVYVNGVALGEPYLAAGVATSGGALGERTFRVAPRCYFVLGDNRDWSADSRIFGAIPEDRFVGKVVW